MTRRTCRLMVMLVAGLAASALSSIVPTGVTHLFQALKDPDQHVREAALSAISRMRRKPEQAIAEFRAALTDEDPGVRRVAARNLGEVGPEANCAADGLRKLLADSDAQTRYNAARAMASILGKDAGDAVPELAKALLGEAYWLDRCNAASALGKIGPKAKPAVADLRKALHDQQQLVRRDAARALGQIGTAASDAVDDLGTSLSDSNGQVRRCATRALGSIGPAAAPALRKALAHSDEEIRELATLMFAQMGVAAVPELRRALGDGNPCVRFQAAWSLALLGPVAKGAIGELLKALEDDDWPDKSSLNSEKLWENIRREYREDSIGRYYYSITWEYNGKHRTTRLTIFGSSERPPCDGEIVLGMPFSPDQ